MTHRERAEKLVHHYHCDDPWYSCPLSTDGCANDDAGDKCNCGYEERVTDLEKSFREVAEEEREACAKIASSFGNRWDDETGFDHYVGEDVAKAIRARGQS